MTEPHDAMRDDTRYELTLFVNGASDLSSRAVSNATQLCEVHLNGRYQLSVVDLHDSPTAGSSSSVLVSPTLVRNRPLPARKLTGDLSDAHKVLVALELPGA